MIKVYKLWLQQFYLLLLWYEMNYGDGTGQGTGERLHRQMMDLFYKGSSAGTQRLPKYQSMAYEILSRTGQVDMQKILPDVLAVLNNDLRNSADGEGDLINVIVDNLRLPYARNYLSGSNLERLRAQLLLPQERSEFKRVTQKREMSCTQCGHEFLMGELSTYTDDGFVCSNCFTPSMMACRSCTDDSAPIPDKLREGLRKVGDCGCKERAKSAPAPQPEVEIPTRVTPMGDQPSAPTQEEALRRLRHMIYAEGASAPTTLSSFYAVDEMQSSPPTSSAFVAAAADATLAPMRRTTASELSHFLNGNRRTRRRPTNR